MYRMKNFRSVMNYQGRVIYLDVEINEKYFCKRIIY
jgi:hypothetical protein